MDRISTFLNELDFEIKKVAGTDWGEIAVLPEYTVGITVQP